MGSGRSWQDMFRFLPGGNTLSRRYAAFRRLLAHDRTAHDCLAELEEIGLGQRRVDWQLILSRYERLLAAVSGMAAELSVLAPWRYRRLAAQVRACDRAARRHFLDVERVDDPPYVIALTHPLACDPAQVGGKAAHLARVQQTLDLPVPAGFVVTTHAFHRLLSPAIAREIAQRLALLDLDLPAKVATVAAELADLVAELPLPEDVAAAVKKAVESLPGSGGRRFAVRSSARSEDGALTFAGQYRTVLNAQAAEMVAAYRQVVASRYSERALHYRIQHGLADSMTPMAVLVLAMVEATVSGIMTVGDGGDLQAVVLHVVAGQGEELVGGRVTPEILRVADGPLVSQLLGAAEIEQLAGWGRRIAHFFGQPQDIEWCRDRQGQLFILQCRPLPAAPPAATVAASPAAIALPLLAQGGERAMGGVGSGKVVRIKPGQPLSEEGSGAVLVAASLPPDYAPLLPQLAAIIAERGSNVGHCALVAREYGVPTLVNVPQAMALLGEGQEVTVDADRGCIYEGLLSEVPIRRREQETPVGLSLAALLAEIAPLRLPEPGQPGFTERQCRSFHDCIRFAHEQGMREMFAVACRRGAGGKGRRLATTLPLEVYLVDIGQGILPMAQAAEIDIGDVASRPMEAIWQGLRHPAICWRHARHFDWQAFGEAVMAGGLAPPDSPTYASYAVVDRDYVHFHIRFGYHYTVVEALAGGEAENNYVNLRFAGGGGERAGRILRLVFLGAVLESYGFRVSRRGDLLDALLAREEEGRLLLALKEVGRLLGASRLLDMVIADEEEAARFAREFQAGRCDFSAPAGRV